MRSALRILLVAFFVLLGASSATAGDDGGVPARTLKSLQRGVNLSLWFTFRDKLDSWWQARQYPDAADWALLKTLKLGHVRVQFDPAWFKSGDGLDSARVVTLRQALKPAWDDGYLVVLAAEPKADEKKRLIADAAGQAELAVFWKLFATALADIPPRQLAFEALNEPADNDVAQNQTLMLTLAQAIRAAAPKHTVIVGAAKFSAVDELAAMTPLALDNLVYTFHFYEPFNFTHQGATWSWPMLTKLKGLPYPSRPEAVTDAAAKADDEARPHVIAYGEARWDAAKVAARLQLAVDWKARNHRPVWCGEFGASRLGPPLEDRRTWFMDVRRPLEAAGIGWSAFDYAGDFGLVMGQQGARALDPADAAANVLPLPPPVQPAPSASPAATPR